MPTLLSERELTLEFADLARRQSIERPPHPLARHKGVHQSGILAWIAREVGWLKPGEPLEEDCPWRMALGVMWEEFYFSLLDDGTVWQPGEMVVDGIAVNCDGIGLWQEETALVETKCTEKKVRSGEDFLLERMWMYQGLAYCRCYGARIVRWVICFYRGDWAGSGPVVKEYVVRFEESEVTSAWSMYLKFREKAEVET